MKKIFTKTILTILTTATAVVPMVSCGNKDRKVVIDSSVTSIVSETHALTSEGHLAITLTVSDPTKEISSIETVTINGNSLSPNVDYYFIEGKVYITKTVLNKFKKGDIYIKPIVGQAEQLLTLTCQSDIEKYRIGHKITKDNLIVKATYLKAGEKVISCGDDGYRIFKNNNDITDDFIQSGYTFTDQDKPTATFEIKFGGKTASVTFKYIFPLKSISVNTTATTLVFRAGDKFSAENLIVDAEYEDESIIQGVKGWKTNYDGHTFTHDELGGQESITLPVTVTYTENDVTKTCTYDITLKHAKVTSLTITKPATTRQFFVGDYFSSDGMEVQANYSTGPSRKVTTWFTNYDKFKTQPFTKKDVGTTLTVLVYYQEDGVTVTTHYAINVLEIQLSKIELINGPTKDSYTPTETFDPTGLKIRAIWNNGDTKEISWGESGLTTDYDKHVFTPKEIGNYIPVTITYVKGSIYRYCTCYISCVDYTSEITTCSWSELNYWSTWLENDVIDIHKFYGHFTKNGNKMTSMSDFIGVEKEFRLNGKTHKVWIIGTQHDLLVKQPEGKTDVKAALTFETKTVVSDDSGNSVTIPWNKSNIYNWTFTNSTLRRDLTGNGDGSPSLDLWVYYLLKDETKGTKELYDAIKPVTKKVYTYSSMETKWKIETFNDPLFALSSSEYERNGLEGDKYEAYIKYPTEYYMKKTDANGNPATYWLRSPNTNNSGEAIFGTTTGGGGSQDVRQTAGISFGFCL